MNLDSTDILEHIYNWLHANKSNTIQVPPNILRVIPTQASRYLSPSRSFLRLRPCFHVQRDTARQS